MRTKVPFSGTFDELFRGDYSVWVKMGAGAAVSVMFAVIAGVRDMLDVNNKLDLSPFLAGMMLVGMAAIGAFVGAALSLKDVVAKRIAEGRPVSLLLRLYFGMGPVAALFIWVLSVVLLALLYLATL